jgi:hypothetical protein
MYRLICSLLVVLVCVGGYLAFNRSSESSPAASTQATDLSGSQATPSTGLTPSSDDDSLKNLKVN